MVYGQSSGVLGTGGSRGIWKRVPPGHNGIAVEADGGENIFSTESTIWKRWNTNAFGWSQTFSMMWSQSSEENIGLEDTALDKYLKTQNVDLA